MQIRSSWINKIETAWQDKSLVWLSGVRRSGKTVLSQSLENIEYFDCELPRVRRLFVDPEAFLATLGKKRIVLDEVHRLEHPSELLKIAADHFPQVKILATGSSTLGASAKFKDTLTGRKREIWLTPMNMADLRDFKNSDINFRLLRGGLPPNFLAKNLLERDYQEWLDAFWAKDIQELFRLERRHSFQKFLELLMVQSGGIFEASRFASPCEISRTTISNYLAVLQATMVAHLVRPFSSRRTTEIITAPKVYTFDTGFIANYNGWQELHTQESGYLWEHFILNELHAYLPPDQIQYWRDKKGHEVDFVIARRGQKPVAIECKWSVDQFEVGAMSAFRRVYPEGPNLVISQDLDRSFSRTIAGLPIKFVNPAGLSQELDESNKT
jgi:predicted AAA+ superfamily ATPase